MDKDFKSDIFLTNWIQDLELDLEQAGMEDSKYYEKRIEYCREFCEFLPCSSENYLKSMKRYEAEGYFRIGMKDKGDEKFKELIKEYPKWPWGYIGWGDMYDDLGKSGIAEEKYRMALNVDLEKKDEYVDIIKRRINDLK